MMTKIMMFWVILGVSGGTCVWRLMYLLNNMAWQSQEMIDTLSTLMKTSVYISGIVVTENRGAICWQASARWCLQRPSATITQLLLATRSQRPLCSIAFRNQLNGCLLSSRQPVWLRTGLHGSCQHRHYCHPSHHHPLRHCQSCLLEPVMTHIKDAVGIINQGDTARTWLEPRPCERQSESFLSLPRTVAI